MKNQKGHACRQAGFVPIFIILVLVLIVGAGAGVYYLWIQKNQVTIQKNNLISTSQLPVDETANWLSYTSTKYNFSIKYPDSMEVQESNSPSVNVVYVQTKGYSAQTAQTSGAYKIEVYIKKPGQTVEEYMNIEPNTPEASFMKSQQRIQINGLLALVRTYKSEADDKNVGIRDNQKLYYIYSNNTGYSFIGSGSIMPNVDHSILDKIVRTFKTIPTDTMNETANWKTYTNSSLGFSFSYPLDLIYLYDQFDDFINKNTLNGNLLLQNFDGTKPRREKASDFQLVVDVNRNQQHLSLNEYIEQNNNLNPSNLQEISINGKKAIRGIAIQKYEKVPVVWLEYKGFIFTIFLETPKSTNAQWFDKILSTFRFSQ